MFIVLNSPTYTVCTLTTWERLNYASVTDLVMFLGHAHEVPKLNAILWFQCGCWSERIWSTSYRYWKLDVLRKWCTTSPFFQHSTPESQLETSTAIVCSFKQNITFTRFSFNEQSASGDKNSINIACFKNYFSTADILHFHHGCKVACYP